MIFNFLTNPLSFIFYLAAIIINLTIHEAAHAWMAWRLGDATAKVEGRLTLNPLAHLDVWGTIMLLLAGFGWGKPVPINPRNFRSPAVGSLIVSFAGPLSNLLLAVAAGILIRSGWIVNDFLLAGLIILTLIGLTLAIFNLLPIPPLDGSHLSALLLPEEESERWQRIGVNLLFLLVFLDIAGLPILSNTIFKITEFLFVLLTGSGM